MVNRSFKLGRSIASQSTIPHSNNIEWIECEYYFITFLFFQLIELCLDFISDATTRLMDMFLIGGSHDKIRQWKRINIVKCVEYNSNDNSSSSLLLLRTTSRHHFAAFQPQWHRDRLIDVAVAVYLRRYELWISSQCVPFEAIFSLDMVECRIPPQNTERRAHK